MRRFVSFPVAAVLLMSAGAQAADLEVNVARIRSSQGNVNVALYADEATFLKDNERLAGVRIPAQPGTVSTTFTKLKPGTYAVAVYHDENGNGRLDKNFLGIPREGYGFSNGARGITA